MRSLILFAWVTIGGTAMGQLAEFAIDPQLSYVSVEPAQFEESFPFRVVAGTRFVNTAGVQEIPGVEGGLSTSISGMVRGEVTADSLSFTGSSEMVAAANPQGPFEPTTERTQSNGLVDNFGALAVTLGGTIELGDLVIRDAVADIVAGSLSVGESAQGISLALTAGTLEYDLPDLDLVGFISLAETVGVVANQATGPVSGDYSETIEIPLGLSLDFHVFSDEEAGDAPDSTLVLSGLIVAHRISEALDGDFNGNGIVEQGDLDLVLLNWGDTLGDPTFIGWIEGIPTGPVAQAELDAVLLHWGARAASLTLGSTVPEPNAIGLAFIVTLAIQPALRAPGILRRRMSQNILP